MLEKLISSICLVCTVAGSTRRSEFLESTTEDLDFVIDLNLRGPYICAREAGKIMKAQGGGKIINISSLMSVLGRATIQPYNATKFAINGLTRGLACELGPYNIQVGTVRQPLFYDPGLWVYLAAVSGTTPDASPSAHCVQR